MRRIGRIVVVLLWLFPIVGQASGAAVPPVVLHWAPIIYQQATNEPSKDVFTVINFDHDWRLNNNSENLSYYPPTMSTYYSLVESDDHYFISYYFYYPRYGGDDKHDNDMTGMLAAVKKNSTEAGKLDMLLTYSNKHMSRWDVASVLLDGGHLNVSISAGNHEIIVLNTPKNAPGIAGIHPLPSGAADQATARIHGAEWYYSGYQLVDFKQLWERRRDIGKGRTFSRWGYFDSYDESNVSVPWIWKFHQDNWLSEPAELLQYYQGTQSKSIIYLDNAYKLIKK